MSNNNSSLPSDPPPSYAQATGSSSATSPNQATLSPASARNGIPVEHRRSMEDERRALPEGWVRRLDPATQHQFFVDTQATPPRSIWQHPYDDEQYLSTLPSEERERIQEVHRHRSIPDVVAMSSDEEDNNDTDHRQHSAFKKLRPDGLATASSPQSAGAAPGSASTPVPQSATSATSTSPTSPSQPAPQPEHENAVERLGRKMKDKLTGTTHSQRESARLQRRQDEEAAYQRHLRYRQALVEAIRTNQPQYLGTDSEGRQLYVQPPPRSYGYGYGSPFAQSGYGYSNYNQDPNTRYVAPGYAYARPRGLGYGGGLGLPLAGGMLGGLLLGSAFF